jgi:PadR family transcriptional regulator PadR
LVTTYLVESPTGPSRKYYRITDVGRTRFESQKTEWTAFSAAVDAILGEAS